LIRFFPALFGLLILVVAGPGMPAAVLADTQVRLATVSNEYPSRIIFKLNASSDANITDVTLSYSITGRSTSALGKPDQDISAAKDVTTQVVLPVNSAQSYIPVGSEFTYHWEIRTDDGQTFSSPDEKFLYLPPNQEWKSVANDQMAVYYHGSKEALANEYLAAGAETWQKVGVDLLKTRLRITPVKVVLFDNEAEMDPARPGAGQGSFDAAVTTCGTKVTADIVLVIPVSCGTPDRTDTLRHEFGHIINQAAGEGALGKLPSWVDEGTAVYAQSAPGNNYTQAFETGVARNRLIPFSQMGTPSSDASQVNLFYGQAYAMVKYLIDKGGPGKYADFFAAVQKGSRFDDALRSVYGFDLAGFEQEFRSANQLGSQQTSPTAAPTRQQTPRTTTTATRTPRTTTVESDDGDGGIGTGTILIGGLAVLFALGAVLSFLAAQILANNRRAAGAASATPAPPPVQPPPQPPPPDDEWSRPPPPPQDPGQAP
jgi:hypothetical protein